VNVAARLEGLAESGGICISRSARDQVRDRLDFELEDLGEVEVKNIARPVRVFRVAGVGSGAKIMPRAGTPWLKYSAVPAIVFVAGAAGLWWLQQSPDSSTAGSASTAEAPATKPSIAVMPFKNRSDDKAQAYFADGISEDITTDLSKVAGLFVTSRSATLKFRNGTQDPKAVATALGVRHILTGSVRRAGAKIRITATLIDAQTGGQLWAERFDRDTQDIFAIQDEISGRVVRQLSETLKGISLKRVERTYTPKVEAYDLYIKGRAERIPPTPPNLKSALAKFEKAIEIDPKFAGGYAGASIAHVLIHAAWGGAGSSAAELDKALKLGQEAVKIDPAFGPAWGSLAEAYFRKGRHEDALEAVQKRDSSRAQRFADAGTLWQVPGLCSPSGGRHRTGSRSDAHESGQSASALFSGVELSGGGGVRQGSRCATGAPQTARWAGIACADLPTYRGTYTSGPHGRSAR
jgi:adenylate cyclase